MFNETEQYEAMLSEQATDTESAEDEQPSGTEAVKASPKRGRKSMPKNFLPSVSKTISAMQKYCPCGSQRRFIGEEISGQLDIIPATIRVLRHVRNKYACKACEEGVHTAKLPQQPIPKSYASAGLIVHVRPQNIPTGYR
jgi:transposase